MPTLLVTAKMSPELAARVERAVTGRKTTPRAMRRFTALVRVAAVVGVVFAVYGIVSKVRASREAEEELRASLLQTAQEIAASLDEEDKQIVERTEPWLTALSAPEWPGDEISAELRRDTLAVTLARPALWVRGATDGFGTSEQIAETARTSPRDALLYCLFDPPSARTEKAVFDKVLVAYSGGADFQNPMQTTWPLHDAMVAMPFFQPTCGQSINLADNFDELVRLRTKMNNAPLERTRRAAKAEILIAAIDEPGTGPTEMDGEQPHKVRLAIVDLRASKLLLRIRRDVDPSTFSEKRRVVYAKGLDSCALAFDVHHELKGSKAASAR